MFNLNAFKNQTTSDAPLSKADLTKQKILDEALKLFREKGFDATTMRDIAATCDMAVGTAYHHFESKEAIVSAYYNWVQLEHLRQVSEYNQSKHSLKQRLEQAFQSKLDIVAGDQKLLGVIMRYVGESEHPLSIFGEKTKDLRLEGLQIFKIALADEPMPAVLREFAPLIFWTLHMGMLLYFLHDTSQGERTSKLGKSALELILQIFGMIGSPLVQPLIKPVLGKVKKLLKTYDLMD
jgi:AcrR family transcriptional regulator